MRISDWSSDVCSSDLRLDRWRRFPGVDGRQGTAGRKGLDGLGFGGFGPWRAANGGFLRFRCSRPAGRCAPVLENHHFRFALRSEEHTSELQSLMRISYAVFCLKKKKRSKQKSLITT